MKYLSYFQYNSVVILSYFFVSLFVFILNSIFGKKLNNVLFSSWSTSIFNPLTYVRFVTHIFGHDSLSHLINNFLYILLIGPMIEEKYGSMNLLIMILVTALVIGILNSLFTNKRILGASGIVFMLIVLSSFVNIEAGKIPITLVLICLFYIINEIRDGLFKKDNVSHLGHLLGALCGVIFGFYYM